MNVDYIEVLDYLRDNAGAPYSKPENKGLSQCEGFFKGSY